MSPTNQSIQPYYSEFLRCAICSHDFEYENCLYRPITLPICGHTMCGQCIDIIRNQTKCPQDQIAFTSNTTPLDQLPTNYPLLILLYESSKVISLNIRKNNLVFLVFSYQMIMNNVMVNVFPI